MSLIKLFTFSQVSEFESVDEHITRNALLHAKMFSEHYKANETKHQQEKTEMVNQIKGLQLELHSTKEKFTQTTRQMQQEFENKIDEFQKVLQVKLSEVEAIKARGVSFMLISFSTNDLVGTTLAMIYFYEKFCARELS